MTKSEEKPGGDTDGLSDHQRALIEAVLNGVRSRGDLRAIIGERLTAAREMNGLQQGHAAMLMGYEGGAQLSQFELGRRLPPVHLLIDAARVYTVSADYLLGVIDDPEPGTAGRQAVVRHITSIVTGAVEGITAMLVDQIGGSAPQVDAWSSVEASVLSVLSAFERFRELNEHEFETGMRGSSRLDTAANELRACVAKVSPQMRGAGGVYTNLAAAVKKHTSA